MDNIMTCIRCWSRGEVLQGSLVRAYLITPRGTLVEIISAIPHKVVFLSSSVLAGCSMARRAWWV